MRRFVTAVLFTIAASVLSAASVPVVPHTDGYMTSLAKHAVRWFGSSGIPSELAPASALGTKLETAKLAVLVGFEKPSEAELKTIDAYLKRGGRLVVLYSSSPRLAALMGVRPLGFQRASYPGRWSCMDFDDSRPDGCPESIRQTSSVLLRAEPVPGRGRVLATWSDRRGKSTGDAAWIATTTGFWMTHVLTADGDEDLKAKMLASFAGFVDPSLWNVRVARKRENAALDDLRAYALLQKPRQGEIRAVWDHSGCGLYPGDWPRTIRLLKTSGVTDLFVNVAGAGFAHYASRVLPRSKTYDEEGDQLAACLNAAKGSGVRVHAWVLCFTGTRATPDRLADFQRRGWRLKGRDGRLTEYLNPALPEVRAWVLAALGEIRSTYAVDGVHLDFVRWYEGAEKPQDAADVITRFVAEARRRVPRPTWLTTAVYAGYPGCVRNVAQDWRAWIDAGTVDYVVPMGYTEDPKQFEVFAASYALTRARAARTIAGIGVTANESRLDARQVIDQVNIARRHGLAGVSLFDLDVTLEKSVLPYLRLGLWKTP